MAYNNNITKRNKNTASCNATIKDVNFNPSVSLGDIKEVTSKDFTVSYDAEGNSLGEPMKIASFGGLGVFDKSTISQDAKFIGICNKGDSSLELMMKVRNYVKQGKILTGVTATAADPTVFTKTDHGLADNDIVELTGFTQMSEINGMIGTVNQLNTSTFEVNGIAADSQETTGGTVTRYDIDTAPVKDIATTARGAYAASPYIQFLLHPGQFMTLPHLRFIVNNSNQTGVDSPVAAALGTEGTVNQTGIAAIDDVTDGKGFVETTDWFGAVSDDEGLVPGSISIIFYSAGYQEFGITNRTNAGKKQTSATDTGLDANTAYRFKCTVDGTANNIVFTTDASDTTWGNGLTGNGVLKKINDRFHAAWKSGTVTAHPKAHIVDGEVRVTSGTRLSTSAIALADSTTGSETQMFGTNGMPHEGSLPSAVAAALETTSLLNRSYDNTDHILIDKGNGTGSRVDGGTFEIIGQQPYSPGASTLRLYNCPPYANFSLYYNYFAALGGQSVATAASQNMISDIYARCVNKKVDKGIVRLYLAT
tara:strand:- start:1124 stop:2731 length:1608 start_codon:yes stop_codon:yes gene_type:complete